MNDQGDGPVNAANDPTAMAFPTNLEQNQPLETVPRILGQPPPPATRFFHSRTNNKGAESDQAGEPATATKTLPAKAPPERRGTMPLAVSWDRGQPSISSPRLSKPRINNEESPKNQGEEPADTTRMPPTPAPEHEPKSQSRVAATQGQAQVPITRPAQSRLDKRNRATKKVKD